MRGNTFSLWKVCIEVAVSRKFDTFALEFKIILKLIKKSDRMLLHLLPLSGTISYTLPLAEIVNVHNYVL